MQALEVRIPGAYWDSVIYDGRLYLFDRNGSITVVNWDKLIESMSWGDDLAPMAFQFLARGRAWYASELRQVLRAPATAAHFAGVVTALTSKSYTVRPRRLDACVISELESPIYPHTDVEMYYNTMYVSGSEGIYQGPLSTASWDDFEPISEAPALRIAASYRSLAIAAGTDGLMEQPLARRFRDMEPIRTISEEHCQSCGWASFDVVASSSDGAGGYLAAYTNPKVQEEDEEQRELLSVLHGGQLFTRPGSYMFGAVDKLIMIGDGFLEAGKWSPYRRRRGYGVDLDKSLVAREVIEDPRLNRDVLDAAASVFGYVVEFDDALVVFANDGTTKRLPEPVNWRCFPRSARYLNHLHVTLEDHVRVYAFVHDYFLPASQRRASTARPVIR